MEIQGPRRDEWITARKIFLYALSERQQVLVGVQQRKFPLAPWLDLQPSIGVYADITVYQRPVQLIDRIRADVHLTIILLRIEVLEQEEVDLNTVAFHHQVVSMIVIAEYGESELAHIVGASGGLVAHGQFGVDSC